MIKKVLSFSILASISFICTSMVNAEECFIRDDLIPAQYLEKHATPNIPVKKAEPVKTSPVNIQEVDNNIPQEVKNVQPTITEAESEPQNATEIKKEEPNLQELKEINNVEENSSANSESETFTPCEELQRNPQTMLKQEAETDIEAQKIFDYFEKADNAIGLTTEQKEKSDALKQEAIEKLLNIQQEITSMKTDVFALKSDTSLVDKTKHIADINNNIKKCTNKIQDVFKQAQKDYEKLLTPEQKKIYKEFQKTNK